MPPTLPRGGSGRAHVLKHAPTGSGRVRVTHHLGRPSPCRHPVRRVTQRRNGAHRSAAHPQRCGSQLVLVCCCWPSRLLVHHRDHLRRHVHAPPSSFRKFHPSPTGSRGHTGTHTSKQSMIAPLLYTAPSSPRLSSRGSVYCGGAAAFPPFLVYCRLPCSAPSTDRMIDPFLFTGLGRGIGPVKQGNTEARQHGCNESLRTNIIQTDSVCERSCVSDRSKLKRQTPQHTYIQGTHILEYDPKLRVNTREQ